MNHRFLFGTLSVAALAVLPVAPRQDTPATITCELAPADGGAMIGECRSGGDEVGGMKLLEGGDGGAPLWVGTLAMQGLEVDVDVKRIEYTDETVLALRTPFGWFPTRLVRDGERLVVSFQESEVPPSEVDLRIVLAARQVLADETTWDRQDDRVCEATDTTFSLYCAMHRATIDVAGEFHHRQPALQAVRVVVQGMWSARYSEHRLMDFNNHPDTTLTDIHATLAEAESRIRDNLSVSQNDLGPVLSTLEGRWEGEGELLDRPAAFGMSWSRSLGGRYLRLEFNNAFTDADPAEPVLESHAYYRLGGTTLDGRWMDSRGVMLSIAAEIVDSTLVSTWSGEENGRTEYTVIDANTVEVTDYVRADGQYHPFASARYRRIR